MCCSCRVACVISCSFTARTAISQTRGGGGLQCTTRACAQSGDARRPLPLYSEFVSTLGRTFALLVLTPRTRVCALYLSWRAAGRQHAKGQAVHQHDTDNKTIPIGEDNVEEGAGEGVVRSSSGEQVCTDMAQT